MIKVQKLKKNLMKILSILTFVVMTSMVLAGCGGDSGSKGLSEDEYKAEVKRISDEITTKSTDYTTSLAGVDPSDAQAVLDATNKFSEQVKPLYQEISALQAPEAFADAQSKIKAGADASVELLDLTMEMSKLGTDENASQDDILKKMEELSAKLTDLSSKAQDFQDAITEITK